MEVFFALFRNAQAAVVALSRWVDESPANAGRDPEARTWGRLSKVSEEGGEVVKAYIGVTGQNPRKGVYATMDDVRDELLDTALTALCAYEHLTDHRGASVHDLLHFALSRAERAGLDGAKSGT